MPKLFVALELPAEAVRRLAGIQPPQVPGIRRASPDQMHLTLHFIGEAAIEQVAAPLQEVIVPSFSLDFEGVGHFPSAGGTVTLYSSTLAAGAPVYRRERAFALRAAP